MHITVTAFNNLHGDKALKLEGIVKLVKEPSNKYDMEAIACEMRHYGKIGYVANSTQTVVIGTMSAGRLYDKINDVYFAKIKFLKDSTAIAKVLSADEYIAEVENPESDVHYLCDDTSKIDVEFIEKHFKGE